MPGLPGSPNRVRPTAVVHTPRIILSATLQWEEIFNCPAVPQSICRKYRGLPVRSSGQNPYCLCPTEKLSCRIWHLGDGRKSGGRIPKDFELRAIFADLCQSIIWGLIFLTHHTTSSTWHFTRISLFFCLFYEVQPVVVVFVECVFVELDWRRFCWAIALLNRTSWWFVAISSHLSATP